MKTYTPWNFVQGGSNSRNDPGVRLWYSDSTRRAEHAHIGGTSQRVANSGVRALWNWKFWKKKLWFLTTGAPLSRALQSPWPFCQIKIKLKFCYHVKEHKKLCKNSKKIDPFKAKKKLRGVKGRIWDIFSKSKNSKIVCKTQYRLARISILDSYDSSVVKSSDDAKKKFPPCVTSLKWGKREKYCLVFEAQFLGGHGL